MKVCIISPHSPSDDAIGEYCRHLAEELCKRAEVVVLANQNAESPMVSKVYPKGVKSHYTIQRIWKPGLLYPFKMFKSIIQQKPDIVHIQHEYFLYGKGYNAVIFPVALLLSRFAHLPLVVTMHHVIPRKEVGYFRKLLGTPIPDLPIKMFLTLFNRIIAFSSVLIVPSETFKKTLFFDYRIDSRNIEVVQHFGDSNATAFSSKEAKTAKTQLGLNGKKVVLFFGYIRPSKGLEYALYAMQLIRKEVPNAVFSIVGKAQPNYANYFNYLRQLVDELELSNSVKFENHVSEDELPLNFAACDAVVFPYTSTVGMTPIAHLKAASFGKPIIATDLDDFRSEFVDHENALLVSPKDPDALSKSVIEVFTNDELSEKLSTNIISYCVERSQEKAIDHIVNIYQDVLEGKKVKRETGKKEKGGLQLRG